ncbi:hypothetical protein DPEC_G00119570 [Dallia pectoralis]|uniref:Uncharacterized protein n=1 Tax=Dallia pectoralis TaxID=75939 RepID=A0ACC2GPW2_DALPE|nr:hypothetical protein DPEC_G00119570 [Dallia pectoralis]
MRGLILAVAFVTLIISTQAFLMHGRQRCLCVRGTVTNINPKNMIRVTVYPRSPTCGRVEIVVKLKSTFKCLNPNSEMGRRIQAVWNMKP